MLIGRLVGVVGWRLVGWFRKSSTLDALKRPAVVWFWHMSSVRSNS